MIVVVVVNPFQNKELSPSLLEKQFRDACLALSVEPSSHGNSITCKVDYVGAIKDADKLLQRTLNEFRHQHHGPAIGVIECPNVQAMKSGIHVLDDFPCIDIPCNARDSQYQALGWQIIAAKIGMQRCAASSQWLNERISLSRYAHVPVGNFELDWLLFTADVFFSRALHDQQMVFVDIKNTGGGKVTMEEFMFRASGLDKGFRTQNQDPEDHSVKSGRNSFIHQDPIRTPDVNPDCVSETFSRVLWISDDGIPDLGGFADEDTCFADEVKIFAASVFLQVVNHTVHQPILTYPGAYRKVTVELKIHHLAVNALLKSSLVNEMEGGALLGFDHDPNSGALVNEQSSFDEASSCAPAFRVLKQLIQRCLSDAVTSGNVFADALLQHLYRPQSKLHDPALHRVLHKVMQKVFALLLAEFRKLGASIVFADFSKIILDTGKSDLDLFEWIELEPLHFWHSLLFMDQYNFGGIQVKAVSGDVSEPLNENTQNEPQVDIVSNWNIAEYLPKATQDHFVLVVSEFIYEPWKYAQKQAAIRDSSREGSFCTPSITVNAAEAFESRVTEYVKELISSHFSGKLHRIVQDTLRHIKGKNKIDGDEINSHGFPQLAGSHAPVGDPALEFIKHVCAVLALDQSVQHDILVMRKNLLKFIRVREFAPEAEFRDPCLSFTLPNVICSYCNDCRDLDLCRDTALLAHEWRCAVPQCGQPYNREQMENALLQVVRQREKLYHLQDLVCLKCNQVKAAHLAEQCGCAGSFRCKEDAGEFLNKMKVFLNIAVHQKFELLQQCTSWILEVH
ncbi:hypothetical protein ACLOJK_031281 [Asimina triloba]